MKILYDINEILNVFQNFFIQFNTLKILYLLLEYNRVIVKFVFI